MISREERWAAIEKARRLVESGVVPSRAYTIRAADSAPDRGTSVAQVASTSGSHDREPRRNG